MDASTAIAASSLQALTTGLRTTARNVANQESVDYTAFRTVYGETAGGGVQAAVSPTADQVDITRKVVDLIVEADSFAANVKVVQTADTMTRKLLDVKV